MQRDHGPATAQPNCGPCETCTPIPRSYTRAHLHPSMSPRVACPGSESPVSATRGDPRTPHPSPASLDRASIVPGDGNCGFRLRLDPHSSGDGGPRCRLSAVGCGARGEHLGGGAGPSSHRLAMVRSCLSLIGYGAGGGARVPLTSCPAGWRVPLSGSRGLNLAVLCRSRPRPSAWPREM